MALVTNFAVLAKCLTDLGYTLENVWRETHGDGEQYTYQAPGIYARTMVISTDRSGSADSLFPGPNNDYRLAREIRQRIQAQPNYWVKVTSDISPCCTASWEDWRNRANGEVYRLSSVAGHGEHAKKIPFSVES